MYSGVRAGLGGGVVMQSNHSVNIFQLLKSLLSFLCVLKLVIIVNDRMSRLRLTAHGLLNIRAMSASDTASSARLVCLHKHPARQQNASDEKELEREGHALADGPNELLTVEVARELRLDATEAFGADALSHDAAAAGVDLLIGEGSGRLSASFESCSEEAISWVVFPCRLSPRSDYQGGLQ